MAELVTSLMIWIAGETGFAIPAPPHVTLVPKEQMSELAYQREWRPKDDVRGLYDRNTATVYLQDAWRIDELRSQTTILHELVHHMQAFNAFLQDDCAGAREEQAYALTLKWLREQGTADAYALLDLDEFTITVLTLCPEG